jgi:hypothetical protein
VSRLVIATEARAGVLDSTWSTLTERALAWARTGGAILSGRLLLSAGDEGTVGTEGDRQLMFVFGCVNDGFSSTGGATCASMRSAGWCMV